MGGQDGRDLIINDDFIFLFSALSTMNMVIIK